MNEKECGRKRIDEGKEKEKRRKIIEGEKRVLMRMGLDEERMKEIKREEGV